MTTSERLYTLASTIRRIGRGHTGTAKSLEKRAEIHKGEK